MRYYSLERPLTIGTHPKAENTTIVNFDNKTFCPEIGREAFGYIDYPNTVLSEEDERNYSLVPSGRKPWWCVTSAFYDNGRVTAAITRCIDTFEKPASSNMFLKHKDVYNDWFDSYEKATMFVAESEKC